MRFLAGLLLLVCLPAFGQVLPTCGPASTVLPQPWNEARVSWTASPSYEGGFPYAAGTVLTYTVYRRVGTTGSFTALCTSTGLATALPGQPVGAVQYTVTARIAAGAESTQPPGFTKNITEPRPLPPPSITVASTRIEPDSWTCRDENGEVLSRHERQDKAQESCTNLAIASLGKAFEMRPSGYRIVAR